MHCDETLLILVDPHCTVIPHLHGYATVAAACARDRMSGVFLFVARASSSIVTTCMVDEATALFTRRVVV